MTKINFINTTITTMDRLRPFEQNDAARLYRVAKHLHATAYWATYLTPSQMLVMEKIFGTGLLTGRSRLLWEHLLAGTALVHTDDNENLDSAIPGSRALTLRVRLLLWGKAMSYFYKENSGETENAYTILEDDDEEMAPVQTKQEEPSRITEDDDYDDDEDDDKEDQKEDSKAPENNIEGDDKDIEYHDGLLVIDCKGLQPPPAGPPPLLHYVYHSFENDRATLSKRQRLQADQPPPPQEHQSLLAQFGMGIGGGLSLKHLLQLIDSNKERVPNLTGRQLRSLIHDVKRTKSKWSLEERIGQEELYEACEKVLIELRNYTQHLTPFLTKVSKRDAPNYYQVIKQPMDLNTVLRKLKALEYPSKQAFADDLQLIWSNCLLYNADPAHHLRKNAIAMQQKTAALLPMVPDITIKSKAEYEREERELEAAARRHQAGAQKGKGIKRTNDAKKTPSDSHEKTPVPSIPSVGEADSVPDIESDLEDDLEIQEDDAEAQAWRARSEKARGDALLQRLRLFVRAAGGVRLNTEAEAVLRDTVRMQEFRKIVDGDEEAPPLKKPRVESEKEEEEVYLADYDVGNGFPTIAFQGESSEDLARKENELLEKVEFQKAMTGEGQMNGSSNNRKSSDFIPHQNGLNKIIVDNVSQMQEIRSICFKMSLIRQMQQNQFIHHTQLKAPVFQKLKDADLDPLEQLSELVIAERRFNNDFIYSIFRKSIGKLLMNTGFEAANPHAVDVVTQVAEQYLGNLIRTIKLHLESPLENRSNKGSILLLSLLENGITKPDDLCTYVRDSVLKQNAKLKELKQKLQAFLKELLRPSLAAFQLEKELIQERNFKDDSDQFVTGDFSNELGEDFFGFRELGLDKEFQMLSLLIPLHLLNSRLSNSFFSTQNASTASKSLIESFDKEIKYKRLLKEDIDKQIGLMKPFLHRFFEKSKVIYLKNFKNKNTQNKELPLTNEENEMLILEDEDLPQKQRNIRPRLPPNGKIGSVRKKPVETAFFLPEDD